MIAGHFAFASAVKSRLTRSGIASSVGDITYIPTWEGWLYLATVIDCHTKAVIGYAMDDNYRTPLIAEAIRNAARYVPIRHDVSAIPTRGPVRRGPGARNVASAGARSS